MVQELRERRANRKKGIITTMRPTGSANVSAGVVSLDFASLLS